MSDLTTGAKFWGGMVICWLLLSDLPLYFHPVTWSIVGGRLGLTESPAVLPVSASICYPSALLTRKEPRMDARSGLSCPPAQPHMLESSLVASSVPRGPSDTLMSRSRPRHPSSFFLMTQDKRQGSLLTGINRMKAIGNTSNTWPASMGASMGLEPRNRSSLNFRCHLIPSVLSRGMLGEVMGYPVSEGNPSSQPLLKHTADLGRPYTDCQEVSSADMFTDPSGCPESGPFLSLFHWGLPKVTKASRNSLEPLQLVSSYSFRLLLSFPLAFFC